MLLAQMGSFVPARERAMGVVDRVFTRVGAADRLARGESTFMVEMAETAADPRPGRRARLVILDEIGRGTRTFDGLSIAWAVAEYLHDRPLGPRTLFATHYHELVDLAAQQPRRRACALRGPGWQGQVVFLRRLGARRGQPLLRHRGGAPGGPLPEPSLRRATAASSPGARRALPCGTPWPPSACPSVPLLGGALLSL